MSLQLMTCALRVGARLVRRARRIAWRRDGGRGGARRTRAAAATAALAAGAVLLAGCTGESVKIALEAQKRADDVQQAVFDRQHEGLTALLYRDLASRLAAAAAGGGGLSDAQRAVLNDAWNERDLIEFWAVQNERVRALRLIAVDMKLYSDQSPLDLLLKQGAAKLTRTIAGAAGAGAAEGARE